MMRTRRRFCISVMPAVCCAAKVILCCSNASRVPGASNGSTCFPSPERSCSTTSCALHRGGVHRPEPFTASALFLLEARPLQDSGHAVVALVTAVLEERTGRGAQRADRGPWLSERRGVRHLQLVVDRCRVDAGQPLLETQRR